MPESGVDHPVTAVLLNFRSYDTLLEIAVLLLAVVVALALREAQPDRPEQMGLENPLLRAP
jgi:multisubunit Na+/H+ antiporter MnhB subunit